MMTEIERFQADTESCTCRYCGATLHAESDHDGMARWVRNGELLIDEYGSPVGVKVGDRKSHVHADFVHRGLNGGRVLPSSGRR